MREFVQTGQSTKTRNGSIQAVKGQISASRSEIVVFYALMRVQLSHCRKLRYIARQIVVSCNKSPKAAHGEHFRWYLSNKLVR